MCSSRHIVQATTTCMSTHISCWSLSLAQMTAMVHAVVMQDRYKTALCM